MNACCGDVTDYVMSDEELHTRIPNSSTVSVSKVRQLANQLQSTVYLQICVV